MSGINCSNIIIIHALIVIYYINNAPLIEPSGIELDSVILYTTNKADLKFRVALIKRSGYSSVTRHVRLQAIHLYSIT